MVVAEKGLQTLPAAYGADLGTVFKPAQKLLFNAVFGYSYLQKEYVYAGDGGIVDLVAVRSVLVLTSADVTSPLLPFISMQM